MSNILSPDFLTGRRLLVISPHPDDETFGCAGTMARAVNSGAEVHVMVISAPNLLLHFNADRSGVSGATRIREFHAAMDVLQVTSREIIFESDDSHLRLDIMPQLDLIGRIEKGAALSLEKIQPDILLFPALSYNQDHRSVFRAVMAACRPHLKERKHFSPTVMTYDQPQLAWSDTPFHPCVYVDISLFLEVKLRAYSCYRSQIHADPHHASLANVERLARMRGSEVGIMAAEAFVCHRMVI